MIHNYNFIVSKELFEPLWDSFLYQSEDSHYTQLSSWAKAKHTLGWKAIRLYLYDHDEIIGGAQLLIKPIKQNLPGTFAYLSKGPVIKGDSVNKLKVFSMFLDRIERLCKEERIFLLGIQPPSQRHSYICPMIDRGYFEIPGENINPPGTAITDLSPDIEEIFSRFKKSTRYDIRHAQKLGLTVRQGDRTDIPTFYHLLEKTAERQKFRPEELDTIYKVWDELENDENITMFLSEYQNEPVSGIILITFNHTAIFWRGAWSGKFSKLCPNEYTHWHAIQWAKENGILQYDMGGLPYSAAQDLVETNHLPEEFTKSVASFKLKFQTEIMLYPQTFFYSPNPVIHYSFKTLFPIIDDNPLIQTIINKFRNH